MADVVNFNKARKNKARAEAKASAVENRVKFGRSKAEKAVTKLEAEKARRRLDDARRDT